MDIMERTVKTRAFSGDANSAAAQSNLTEAQEQALEFAKNNARLREEMNRSLEFEQTIGQLRASLEQEQARSASMAERAVMLDARVRELSGQGANADKVTELEARVRELAEALAKISGIAAAGKAG
jgi:hypothetical protein